MALSVLDLFSVGIGPSSSHTVGPMRAAKRFAEGLAGSGQLKATVRVQAELFGSLGATGRGHGSDKAVVLGLQGLDPETVDTATADDQVAEAVLDAELWIAGHRVDFNWDEDVVLHRRKSLPAHPNGMTFRALDHAGVVLHERSYYSIGGGFVVDGDADGADKVVADTTVLPYPFTSADELWRSAGARTCRSPRSCSPTRWCGTARPSSGRSSWRCGRSCVNASTTAVASDGILPGGLKVKRRAPSLFRTLTASAASVEAAALSHPTASRPRTPCSRWSGSTCSRSR